MKLLAKLIGHVLANALGLWFASTYIPLFGLAGGWQALFLLALALAVMNFILGPILKLLLGPIIILTLGIGLILVNALILAILDKFSAQLTIGSIPALIWGTIIIGVANFLIHLIP
ncbi:MAG TPA: phage holin family protein [Candidatus Paceibacterota bacterium]|nr:phage holin family protein [Candidatus Paceibacterota bacterium]